MGKAGQFYLNGEEAYQMQYYPVGWILHSFCNINPSEFCIGTWERVSHGRMLIGLDENDGDFNVPWKTGGEKLHHLSIAEMPGHQFRIPVGRDSGFRDGVMSQPNALGTSDVGWNAYTNWIGGDVPHNNIPPYIACYIWVRTS